MAVRLNETGRHDAIHPRDYGRLGEPDRVVLARCLAEDRTIVTQNARDFRKLVGAEALHPGLIILPAVGREHSMSLLNAAMAQIQARGDPAVVMVNHVVEIDMDGAVEFHELPFNPM